MANHPGAPTTFGPGWSDRVLEHARPFIVRRPNEGRVFWPTTTSGPWNNHALRLIVDELERRNGMGADRG